uniref:Uncharacterized protein n=1 Tax=Coccidioides posadasii RMSCC 3488 TaxID=454284 RepID=A0A0J6F5A8_COCPO|nr:hypothetical protein CPAG_00476 [Coccidioides posadasii RMSCC 3488]
MHTAQSARASSPSLGRHRGQPRGETAGGLLGRTEFVFQRRGYGSETPLRTRWVRIVFEFREGKGAMDWGSECAIGRAEPVIFTDTARKVLILHHGALDSKIFQFSLDNLRSECSLSPSLANLAR